MENLETPKTPGLEEEITPDHLRAHKRKLTESVLARKREELRQAEGALNANLEDAIRDFETNKAPKFRELGSSEATIDDMRNNLRKDFYKKQELASSKKDDLAKLIGELEEELRNAGGPSKPEGRLAS